MAQSLELQEQAVSNVATYVVDKFNGVDREDVIAFLDRLHRSTEEEEFALLLIAFRTYYPILFQKWVRLFAAYC